MLLTDFDKRTVAINYYSESSQLTPDPVASLSHVRTNNQPDLGQRDESHLCVDDLIILKPSFPGKF